MVGATREWLECTAAEVGYSSQDTHALCTLAPHAPHTPHHTPHATPDETHTHTHTRNTHQEELEKGRRVALQHGVVDLPDITEEEYFNRPQRSNWDCATIVSTYSNLENHPSVIDGDDMSGVIMLSSKTGLPLVSMKAKRKQHKRPEQQADAIAEEGEDGGGGGGGGGGGSGAGEEDDVDEEEEDDDDDESVATTMSTASVSVRNKGETAAERKERKAAVKEARRLARVRGREEIGLAVACWRAMHASCVQVFVREACESQCVGSLLVMVMTDWYWRVRPCSDARVRCLRCFWPQPIPPHLPFAHRPKRRRPRKRIKRRALAWTRPRREMPTTWAAGHSSRTLAARQCDDDGDGSDDNRRRARRRVAWCTLVYLQHVCERQSVLPVRERRCRCGHWQSKCAVTNCGRSQLSQPGH